MFETNPINYFCGCTNFHNVHRSQNICDFNLKAEKCNNFLRAHKQAHKEGRLH